jgi:hypothetical protein
MDIYKVMINKLELHNSNISDAKQPKRRERDDADTKKLRSLMTYIVKSSEFKHRCSNNMLIIID